MVPKPTTVLFLEGTMLWNLTLSLLASVVVTQIAVFSTTIYLHRTATHRALVLNPVAEWFFRFNIWLTTGIVPDEWVAVHLKHHAFTDKEGDPHSPRLEGFWRVQWGNVFYYLRELKDRSIIQKYASHMKKDEWDRILFNHGLWGPVLGTIVLCLVLGIGWGLLAAGIHAFMYVFVLSSSINGLCHYAGYKNFDNTATNIRFIALVTGGEGYHNNHHEYPRSPKFSFRWSEFDPAWPVIWLLEVCHLARWRSQTIEEIMAK